MEHLFKRAAKDLSAAKHIVALTGAGISVRNEGKCGDTGAG